MENKETENEERDVTAEHFVMLEGILDGIKDKEEEDQIIVPGDALAHVGYNTGSESIPEQPTVYPVSFNPFLKVPMAKQKSKDHDRKRKARIKAQKQSRKNNRKRK